MDCVGAMFSPVIEMPVTGIVRVEENEYDTAPVGKLLAGISPAVIAVQVLPLVE